MVAARLTDIADRKLTITVLKEVHAGEEVQVEIDPEDLVKLTKILAASAEARIELGEPALTSTPPAPINPAREALRARMIAAGMLGTAHTPPPGTTRPTEAEILEAGTLEPGARQSHELIQESRRDR